MTTATEGAAAPDFVTVGEGANGRRIAVRARQANAQGGGAPGLFWLSGFNSDMAGTKAVALDAWAAEHGRGCSEGRFVDGTIGRWLEEALAVFDRYCKGPTMAVGSSMGGWIALLVARELKRRGTPLAGLVLIAPAPDFTEELMWKDFPDAVKREIEANGVWMRPSEYGDPYPITRGLIEDGRKHLLLGGSIDVGCPVRILQGAQDPDVPWRHAFRLTECLPTDDVVLTMVQDGDHRLSRPQDIARLLATVGEL